MARSSTLSDRYLPGFDSFPNTAYCWAVYRWDEEGQKHWDFVRYWERPSSGSAVYSVNSAPKIYPFENAAAQRAGPPNWSSPFNTLGEGHSVHWVPYPAPPRWYVLFDSTDPRFNSDLER